MKPTIPVYRSAYVFVSRRDRHLRLHSLRDPQLRTMKIGLHLVEDDFTPPGQELVAAGMLPNIVSYTLYGNPLAENPAANLVHGVADQKVDVGVVWGPTAGYFAAQSNVPLVLSSICPSHDRHALPVAFDISLGVRRDEPELLAQVNRIIRRRRPEFQRLLRSYHVPLGEGGACH
jgi:mxaJ protein